MRIAPYNNAVPIAIVPAVLSLSVLLAGFTYYPILLLDVVLIMVLIMDFLTLPRQKDIAAERRMPHTFALGRSYRVTITISNRFNRTLSLEVTDDVPASAKAEGAPVWLELHPNSSFAFDYQLAFHSRGSHAMNAVHLRAPSRWGLWQRTVSLPVPDEAHVYPDLRQVTDYLTLARLHQVNMMGIRQVGKAGGDNEFERLKEYHTDDEFRHIAWRATARRTKLISKVYQINENQSVVFMLDCGRMMLGQVNDTRMIDYALNAILMLSYIALNNHDKVGLLTFTDRVDSYLPPNGGPGQIKRLTHAVYDRFAVDLPSDFSQALGYITRKWRKRTLLILITQAIDDRTFESLKREFTPLRSKHLPLLVMLRDREVEEMIDEAPETARHLYRTAAASEYLTWRERHIEDLRRQGILCLDVYPEQLNVDLVNEYLRVKAQHLL